MVTSPPAASSQQSESSTATAAWSSLFYAAAAALLCGKPVGSLDNGVALTPPMGWMTWERYGCGISEDLIVNITNAMVEHGYRDAGYEYVNIDDCWQASQRDSNGKIVADPKTFPHGIKWLADFVHSKDLKLGIYTDYGTATCEGRPGTPLKYQEIDAQTYAEWGVDSVKVDGCNQEHGIPADNMSLAYPRFGDFLNRTGRPMVYSCSWPDYENDWYFDAESVMKFKSVAKACNIWRMYRDIYARWDQISDIIHFMGERQHVLQEIAGPGQFNDADQLIVGDHRHQGWCYPDRMSKHSGCYGLSVTESKTMMALWSIWATPLLMSNDLTNITAEDQAILKNKAVIAINQDPNGVQGTRIVNNVTMGNVTVTKCASAALSSCKARTIAVQPIGGSEVWAKPLTGGDVALVLYNKGEFPINVTVDLTDIMAFNNTATGGVGAIPLFKARVIDLFTNATFDATFNVTARDVPPHGSSTYRISALPSGWIQNSGTNESSLVSGSCGCNPGNPAWKAVDGVLLFECGLYGWDACQVKPGAQPWIDFDLKAPTTIDGFALWNGGDGQHDVSQFTLMTSTSSAGPWAPVGNATFKATTHNGNLQTFFGFEATSQFWRWNVTAPSINVWVKEVQFRKKTLL